MVRKRPGHHAKRYEVLLEELELVWDIRRARTELAEGEGIAHEEVADELRARLER